MLDIARKFHTVEDIKKYIDMVAELGGSYIQLHFSDDENYAIQSNVIGQIKSESNPNVLTFDEVSELSQYAKGKGIELVPELEFPAHSTKLLDLLFAKDWDKWNSVRTHEGGYQLHTGSPETYDFIVEMIDELMPVFSNSSFIHLGGDEFEFGTENTESGFVSFMNRISDYCRDYKNIQLRIWNDAITKDNVKNLYRNIVVVYWSLTGDATDSDVATSRRSTRATMQECIDNDLSVVNANSWFCYAVPNATTDWISSHNGNYAGRDALENWDLSVWDSTDKNARIDDTGMVIGGMFCIWSENTGEMPVDTVIRYRRYHVKCVFDIISSYNEVNVSSSSEMLNTIYNGYINLSKLPENEYNYYILGNQRLNLDNSIIDGKQHTVVLNGDTGDSVTISNSYGFEFLQKEDSYNYYKSGNLTLKINVNVNVNVTISVLSTSITNKFDVNKTIISQYANSKTLLKIIEQCSSCIPTDNDIQNFYDVIWNIDTASGFGLDILGKIIGVDRYININKDTYFSTSSLSFQDVLKNQEISTLRYKASDELYKLLIAIKAMSNIMYVSAPNINRILSALFNDRGRAYFVKSGTMKARYVFEFNLTNVEKAIIIGTDILPRPTGVLIDFYEPDLDSTFGFDGSELTPFNVGAFYVGDEQYIE